ncbi:CaiB/BaiF CoA transferase family protein [Nocardia vaccinii]|uniref:CaiB/BaiF CoA transferase family protein n=1 Tax=Nocardia vaccinii TaxID=1822 RepID=UPI000832B2FD|nr:CaiB/BaiF CoA-transferase family protein [Nocardia vaccinii]
MTEDIDEPKFTGPLAGVRVVELAGLGPGPFATMLLADLGADVVRLDRPVGADVFPGEPQEDLLNRGKRSVVLDLKDPAAVEVALALVEQADVLVEGYRPGVAERIGLGPEVCRLRNPRLVYGRMTGWGGTGPLAQQAGHDIDYIAVTGALHAIGDGDGPPRVPLNLVGDFGGGGMYLVVGILSALRVADRTGVGQVVDAAIVDGTAHLLTGIHAFLAAGAWTDQREANMLDGGAPFYTTYATADGRHMAVGAIEPKFYRELLDLLGLDEVPQRQHDRAAWPEIRGKIAAAFATRTQAEWCSVFGGADACVAPVASLCEAANHPQIAARGTIVERDGVLQAAPAPRFSATPTTFGGPPPLPGQHTCEVLRDWGIEA